jgi:signal-transduction protein with cAMP-binding, CBS, and nucleotidyltransferase domain
MSHFSMSVWKLSDVSLIFEVSFKNVLGDVTLLPPVQAHMQQRTNRPMIRPRWFNRNKTVARFPLSFFQLVFIFNVIVETSKLLSISK